MCFIFQDSATPRLNLDLDLQDIGDLGYEVSCYLVSALPVNLSILLCVYIELFLILTGNLYKIFERRNATLLYFDPEQEQKPEP